MNFFDAQDRAKKKTKYLILVYLLALLVLTVLSSLVLLFLVPFVIGQPVPNLTLQSLFSPQHWPMFAGVGAFVLGGALLSSYIKSRHLAKGGAVVAASLGGVKISPNTQVLNEKKVLNVVEEMAIASGMPVPEVFLLKQENSINAFAAGQTPMDAVIGVTQGCIDKLTRTQLQGVIGHEFSHILNGDMRLNLRIIMLLHGIEFIGLLGRILTSSQRRNRYRRRSSGRGNGVIVLAGIALRIIGWFGVLLGNLIQAAVSRQREFLADASAVQFTRDPSSIADALKVIGHRAAGSRIKNSDVNEVAHMFIAQSFVTRFSSLFATHPPIEQRITSIEPAWDGVFLSPQVAPLDKAPESNLNQLANSTHEHELGLPEPLALLLAAGVMIDELNPQQQSQLSTLVEQSSEPLEAMGLILAVFLLGEYAKKSTQSEQYKTLTDKSWQALLAGTEIKGLPETVQHKLELLQRSQLHAQHQLLLPLVELGMPALKAMSKPQYHAFKKLITKVIFWDKHQSIFEQSLFLLITRYLDVHFGEAKAHQVKYRKASQIRPELQLLFSCLVHYGHAENGTQFTKQHAYQKALHHLGFDQQKLMDLAAFSTDQQQVEMMFNRAVEKCVHCSANLKQQIVEAINITIEYDGEVNQVEKELALAIAATMDAPIPRLPF